MKNNKVLAVSVHPDDETLGCGGTILKHGESGHELYWLIITNISTSEGFGAEEVKGRQDEILKVQKNYGFKKIFKLDLPTTKLDRAPLVDIIEKIGRVIKEVEPNIIYLPNRSDAHSDHRIAFDAVISCTKSFRYPFIDRVLMYETISETEFAVPFVENAFMPNAFCNITKYIDKKIEIMHLYAGELQEPPFPRSEKNIRALATYRGAIANVEYAEAFMILKDLF
jgi:LmbE family N-acetylglucosaminyl deacetylase